MRKILNVRGTQSEVSSLEVNVDTVYSRTNIQRIETEDFNGWQYDEMQFALREYQESLGGMVASLGKSREGFIIDNNATAELVILNMDDINAISNTLTYILEEIEKLKVGEMK